MHITEATDASWQSRNWIPLVGWITWQRKERTGGGGGLGGVKGLILGGLGGLGKLIGASGGLGELGKLIGASGVSEGAPGLAILKLGVKFKCFIDSSESSSKSFSKSSTEEFVWGASECWSIIVFGATELEGIVIFEGSECSGFAFAAASIELEGKFFFVPWVTLSCLDPSLWRVAFVVPDCSWVWFTSGSSGFTSGSVFNELSSGGSDDDSIFVFKDSGAVGRPSNQDWVEGFSSTLSGKEWSIIMQYEKKMLRRSVKI